jgi:uncharacterized membrane protein
MSAYLILGLALFLGVHSVRIFADDWRTAQVARMGELPWKGVYALFSIAGLALIVWGYGLARADPVVLWIPPVWTRHLAALLTVPAFILLVAAYLPGSHIKAKIGHPMVAGVKIWALAHLLANGNLADVILFGAFLVWSIVNFVASRRRDRLAGRSYVAQGWSRDAAVAGIGLLAWALFALWGHTWLIGVKPFGA